MHSSISALILAGGQSSRMGQDKALLSLHGRTFLQHVCEIAGQVTHEVLILTPWPEKYQSILDLEWNLIQEMHPGQGPLNGFLQGLQLLSTRPDPPDWILLLACDLPLLDPDTLQAWAEQLQQLGMDQLALIPHQPQGWEPLCAFYRLQCFPGLSEFAEAGGRSFQSWLDQIAVQPLHLSEPEKKMLWNCNTPTDFKKIQGV
ncbi:MAG: molybdenum cofactor guanylyltransferase [Synechococcaceae cyanobacterium SM2_3_1]|nr:molybdenum cofactor guanylyltransferase [Synechococcaceae cyanobacterium SM2_3_1]